MIEEFKARRTAAALSRRELDGLLATDPTDIYYFTGFEPWRRLQNKPAVAVIAGRGNAAIETALVVPVFDLGYVPWQGEAFIPPTYPYGTFDFMVHEPGLDARARAIADAAAADRSLSEAVEEACARLGVAGGRVGVDSAASLGMLASNWGGAHPLREEPMLVPEVQMVKSEREIAGLRRAAGLNHRALEAAHQEVVAGKPHVAWYRRFEQIVRRGGGEVDFFCADLGADGGFIFPPGDRPAGPGDVMMFEAGLRLERYFADVGGVWCLGELPEDFRRLDRVLRAGMRAGLARVRPGVRASDVFETIMEVIDRGIPGYRRSHCGHGIGLKPRDLPMIARGPSGQYSLEPGMVVNLETPLFYLGYGGLQCECSVVVNATGFEFLVPPISAINE